MNYRPYPQYKDSGVEWLGKVPEGWEVKRFRFLLRDGYDGLKIGPFGSQLKSDMLSNDGYKVYGQENVINGDFERGLRFVGDDKFEVLKVYEIKPNDILITMMGTSGCSKVTPDDIEPGIMDSHLIRLRTKDDVDRKFVSLIIDNAPYVKHQMLLLGKGSIMHGLNSSIIKELWFCVPPIDRQYNILDFIENEVGKIDALIEKKQKLIELLQEKRTAIISHAVTKGLDPKVRRKDSGVAWLGEVPEHWEVKQLKWAVMFQRGHDLPSDAREDGTIPIVSSAGVSGLHNEAKVRGPGIVTGRYGTIGEFYLVAEDYWPLNTTLYTIDLRGNNPLFLRRMLQHVAPLFILNSMKSAVPGIDRNDIHTVQVVLPPILEQKEISVYLDRETIQIDSMIEMEWTAIEKLQEYRTALISAAVTGKIDVRSATA